MKFSFKEFFYFQDQIPSPIDKKEQGSRQPSPNHKKVISQSQPFEENVADEENIADQDKIDDDDTTQKEEEKIPVTTNKKIGSKFRNSTASLKKVLKKTIQKKAEKITIQNKLKNVKQSNKIKPRRPAKEVFLTNPSVLNESPFKKPKLGGDEKRELSSSSGVSLDNRQILESITTAAKRHRRGSSSSTVSSTSDSNRSSSR